MVTLIELLNESGYDYIPGLQSEFSLKQYLEANGLKPTVGALYKLTTELQVVLSAYFDSYDYL
jgi:hypothetical protein